VPLALLTAGVYSFHFVAPIGKISLGFTEDTLTIITFVCVAVFLSEIGRRRDARRAERERQRSALLRSVSHDLRNPLTTIRAASAELRGDAIKDEAVRNQLLDLVLYESERLDRIIRNLLSLSRIEAGAFLPAVAPESLREIVADSVERLRRIDRGDGHRQIIIDIPDDVPDVLVDRTQLDQVITNLVENALRHALGSDVVQISAHRPKAGKGMVMVAVSDRGPGFAASAKAHAFSYFQPSGATGVEGIGLAVCKAIIDAHGGSICAGDESGGGARVEFSIPSAQRHLARFDH
jgi:two-component system sensor histidine kinase KdpD